MIITADGITDLFAQIDRLRTTNVTVHCGHCSYTADSVAQFAVHLLACECTNPGHSHLRSDLTTTY